MKRAWISGATAVFLAHLAWFGLIVVEARVDGLMPLIIVMLLVIMNIAGAGAFITARMAPKNRLLLALTMAPVTALFGTFFNLLFRLIGVHVNIAGFYTDLGLFEVLLGYGAFVSLVGGAIGMWIGRKRVEEPVAVPMTLAAAGTLPEMTVSPAVATNDLPQIRSD